MSLVTLPSPNAPYPVVSSTSAPRRRVTPLWALISAAWLGPAVLAALDSYVQSKLGNRPPASWRVLAWDGGDWLIYGLLTPLVFRLARLFPLRRPALGRNIGLHVLASLVLCAAWAGAGLVLRHLLLHGPDGAITTDFAISWFFTTLPFGVLVYFAVLVAERAVHYFQQVEAHETQTARLSAQLAESRLAALRMQLHPHFLFNSLNALAVLVRDQDTPAASRMLELLSDVLRRVLQSDQSPETSLAAELDFARDYLAIEQIRFSDRLQPIFDIDPSVLYAAVPTFVLQPLLENALRHGIAKRTDAGELRIVARREREDLILMVQDDGPGPSRVSVRSGGVGLANTRARLAALHGPRATVELTPGLSAGALAVVRFPYREYEPSTEGRHHG